MKSKLSRKDLDELIVEADKDKSGKIDYRAFCSLLCPEIKQEKLKTDRKNKNASGSHGLDEDLIWDDFEAELPSDNLSLKTLNKGWNGKMLLSCTHVGIEKLKSRKKKIFGQKIPFKIMIFEKNNFAQQFVCIRGFNWLGPVNNHLKFFANPTVTYTVQDWLLMLTMKKNLKSSFLKIAF